MLGETYYISFLIFFLLKNTSVKCYLKSIQNQYVQISKRKFSNMNNYRHRLHHYNEGYPVVPYLV